MEQIYCDPVQRLVADCVLMDVDTAFVSDRKGSVVVLSCANHLEGDLPVNIMPLPDLFLFMHVSLMN